MSVSAAYARLPSIHRFPAPLAGFALALVLAFLIYRPALQGPLLFDDFAQIKPIMSRVDAGNWLTTGRSFLGSNSGPLGRPLSMATFILDAVVAGADVPHWKAVNLAIHLLTGLVLFWLTVLLRRATDPAAERGDPWAFGAVVTTLWLLHPLQVSTVMYTVQRMTELAALFTFAGLLSYAAGRAALQSGRRLGGWLGIAAAFAVFLPLAALSKENGVLLAPLLLALEVLVYRFRAPVRTRNILAAVHAGVVILPGLLAIGWLGLHFHRWIGAGFERREFTLVERLLTEGRVLVMYLGQIVWPWPGNMAFFYDNFEISHGLFDPLSTALSAALLGALALFAAGVRRRAPLVAFGVALFFIGQLLESSIVALDLAYEHRNYLPSFGIVLALATVAHALVPRRAIVAIAATALFAVAACLTVRASLWSTPQALYPSMLASNPGSKRIAAIFAEAFTTAGRFDDARAVLQNFTGPGIGLQRLYIDCRQRGALTDAQLDEARAALGTVVVTHYEMEGLLQLANLGLDGKCAFSHAAYVAVLDGAASGRVRDEQARQKLLIYKAHYLHEAHRDDAAFHALEASYAAAPENPIPLFLAAEWEIDRHEVAAARRYYQRAMGVAQRAFGDFSEYSGPLAERLRKAS